MFQQNALYNPAEIFPPVFQCHIMLSQPVSSTDKGFPVLLEYQQDHTEKSGHRCRISQIISLLLLLFLFFHHQIKLLFSFVCSEITVILICLLYQKKNPNGFIWHEKAKTDRESLSSHFVLARFLLRVICCKKIMQSTPCPVSLSDQNWQLTSRDTASER